MINYSISFCDDFEQIIFLWQSVFQDSREDILFFLNNCRSKKCIGAFVDNKLVSMLFMVDCQYGNLNGKYIYAVSTLQEFRGNGIASSLIETAKKYMHDFLWLIPAEKSLIDYYKKFGFQIKLYSFSRYSDKMAFSERDDIVAYLYEGCELDEPVGMVLSNTEFHLGDIGLINKES